MIGQTNRDYNLIYIDFTHKMVGGICDWYNGGMSVGGPL